MPVSALQALMDAVVEQNDESLADAFNKFLTETRELGSVRYNHMVVCCEFCGTVVPQYESRSVEGDIYCDSCCEDNAYYWDSDGEWHHDEEPAGYVNGLPDSGTFSREDTILSGVNWTPDLMGVEIEIDCHCHHQEQFFDVDELNHYFVESDGSLDSDGMEFSFRPYDWRELINPTSKFGRTFKSINRFCEPNNKDYYGIHISVPRNQMTPEHAKKFAGFFHQSESLSSLIGNRDGGSYNPYYPEENHLARPDAERLMCYKTQACAMHQRRIEVRLFKSTTDWSTFVSYIEYVRAVWEFTQNVTYCECKEDNFIRWMSSPINQQRFPTLAARMPAEEFVGM